MGWLIFSLVIFVVCVVLLTLNDTQDWDSEVVGTAGAFLGLCSFIAAVVLSAYVVDTKDSADVTVASYNNVVEITNELGVPSDAVVEKILDLNETIIDHRVRSESFWTKGLYSKDVAALPLLEVPEVMKNIEYD